MGFGEATRAVCWMAPLALLAIGCMPQQPPDALVRDKYPECEQYISADNPTVKNGIIRFDCGAAVDGPLYYLNASDGSVISVCGGACLTPDPQQQQVCQTLCPPPQWQWPGAGATWNRFEIDVGYGLCPPGEICSWSRVVSPDGSVQVDDQGTSYSTQLSAGDLAALDTLLSSPTFELGMKIGFVCDPPPTDIGAGFVLDYDDGGHLAQGVTGCVTSSTDTPPRQAYQIVVAY